ncbi:MAG: hypothetical protein ACRYFA_05710 [Janthinobacterium lividum]
MKKILVFIVLILAVALVCLIPFKQQKMINIKVQYFIALQQLLQPENWRKWQPEIKQAWEKDSVQVKLTKNKLKKTFTYAAPKILLLVNNEQGFAFNILKDIYGKVNSYTYIAIPKLIDNTANIIVVTRTSIVKLLYEFFINNSTQTDIISLKNYLEDPRQYYGFDIRRTMVTDSNIVVEKKRILVKNKSLEIAQTEQDLKAYIQQQNLKIVQPVIADIRNIGQDSLRLMIGLPINKQTVSGGKIQFMHQPPHGHMLIGFYNGRYGGRQKLYLAMKTYIADHNLSSPEDAYEKYLDNKIPVSDTSWVRLQVNFPIF